MSTENQLYNFSDIKQIFDLETSRDAFYSKADKEDIPGELREVPYPTKTNKNGYRYWNIKDLSVIGKNFSKLPSGPKSGEAPVINFYVSKGGGSHKTTDAFNLASFLGLHGKKVLVVGLDFQMNISRKFNINNSKSAIEHTKMSYKSMYDLLVSEKGEVTAADCVYETQFPNVWIIPESSNLVRLEAWLLQKTKREYRVKNELDKLRRHFDVIIIDNNPSWSQLSINALFACDINIASIGTDSNTLEALPQFFDTLNDSEVELNENWLVLGITENNNFKTQSRNTLKKLFGDICLVSDIRKSPRVDEANALHLPVLLHDPKSPVADDYKAVCSEIWARAVDAKNAVDARSSNRKSNESSQNRMMEV